MPVGWRAVRPGQQGCRLQAANAGAQGGIHAAIEATAASIAVAAGKAHHANSEEQKDTPQISAPTSQADNSSPERLRPAPVEGEEESSPTEIPKPDIDLEFLLISSVRREMKAVSLNLF